MRANDAVSGLLLILLAGVMIALTASFPAFPGQRYGPALFPRLLGSGLIVCGALLMWQGLAARRAGEPWLAFAPWTREPRRLLSFLFVLGAIVLYILLAGTVGFIPLVFAILAGLFLWFGVRWLVSLPLALGVTLAMHWFFASAMRIPLPRGWLDAFL
jgi:putative tricarboxylic transport membrane protein